MFKSIRKDVNKYVALLDLGPFLQSLVTVNFDKYLGSTCS